MSRIISLRSTLPSFLASRGLALGEVHSCEWHPGLSQRVLDAPGKPIVGLKAQRRAALCAQMARNWNQPYRESLAKQDGLGSHRGLARSE